MSTEKTGREAAQPRFDPLPAWAGPSTTVLHGARRPERNSGAVVPPIYQTTTFHFPGELSEVTRPEDVHLYTRYANPTDEVPAEIVRRLEGAAAARAFGSGMGAISTTLLTFLHAGDEVVALEDLYGGSLEILRRLSEQFGVQVRWVSAAAAAEPESVVGSATRFVLLESPSNPMLRVTDIARWAKAADRAGAILAVDNTFATPINQQPLALGADLVIHSATKYLGGHADLMGGVVVGPKELVERVDATSRFTGSVLDPFAAFLLTRSLRTLPLRVERQNENGRRVAEALEGHPAVTRVHYPGRGSPEQEEIARRQMSGRGGMLSVEVKGGSAGARKFMGHLRFVHPASSLGGVESLASVPRETSHVHLTEAQRQSRGITEGLVRLSLGLEDAEDLVRDLIESLDQLR